MNIEEFEVMGEEFTRKVWFSAGPNQAKHPLCVILDGEHYMKSMNALSTLAEAIARGRIPNMSVAFVSHNGARARHEDYVCNDRFARYIAIDLVSWAKDRVNSIQDSGNLICGVSLSGLASAHIAIRFPMVFSYSLAQSGSFWWSRCQFASLASSRSTVGSRFWISVGDKETDVNVTHPPTGMFQEFSQIAGARSAVDVLKSGGAEVKYNIFAGGHEFGPWTRELGDAVQWLMSRAENGNG
jgi:enterochelin esterase-like enzyme